MLKTLKLVSVVAAALGACAAVAERNVILIIGDGMDDQQITIARNYLVGAGGRLTLDSMPVRGVSQVLTVSEQGEPVYVADSANSGSAMATGQVTSRGRISTTPGTDKAIATIVEIAQAAGYKTGVVSTASVTDATPAVFMSHINTRFCQGPDSMVDVSFAGIALGDCSQYLKASGGPGSISEQIAASNVDVILGGGLKHFQPGAEGSSQTVIGLAENNGYQVVTDAARLAGADRNKKLLGLFSPDTMPVRLRGENGRGAEKPKPGWAHYIHSFLGGVTMPEPMSCEDNPEFAGMPSLRQMTDTALARLGNDRGFFLMVESASIDKESHERRPCGSIGELGQLNEALDSALAFAEEHPDTLILVTADHSQAAQMIPAVSLYAAYRPPVFTPGQLARIKTPEGSIMSVNYATNNFLYEEHTGANVPVFSNSEGIGRIPTMITQPEIFEISRRYLGL